MGFCNLLHHEEAALPECWQAFDRFPRKDSRDHIVESTVFQGLKRLNLGFQDTYILHADLKKAITRLDFAPDVFSHTKPHLGLGPLAFVARDANEVTRITRIQNELAHGSHNLQFDDVEKTTMAPPTPPTTILELYNALELQCIALKFLFTSNCPLAFQIQKLLDAITTHRTNLVRASGPQTIPSILQLVTLETHNFFSQQASEEDVKSTTTMPQANLSWLIDQINYQQPFSVNLIASQFSPPPSSQAPTKKRPATPAPAQHQPPPQKGSHRRPCPQPTI